MTRTLSHGATPVLKFVFPLFWILVFGWGTLQLWVAPEDLVYNGVRGSAPPEARWLFAAMWVLGTTVVLAFATRLRRVRLIDGVLYASNYRTEIVVPWEAIERVTQACWLNPRLVTLHLAQGTPLGRRIRFAPAGVRRLAFWREDEVVAELRAMVEQAALARASGGRSRSPARTDFVGSGPAIQSSLNGRTDG